MILSITVNVNAEWIDDWIQQKTYSGPAFLKSQKRGFASAGTASYRWKTGVDHPFTIAKPRLKSGCGGIDLFLGGASFLNADYLVDKLQSMLSAAPAIAFQIALKTMSDQAATTLSEFTAIIDRLNQLQFDDCKSAKAIVTTTIDSYKAGELKTEAMADWSNSSGLTDLYTTAQKSFDGKTPQEAASAVGGNETDMISSCPDSLKKIFFENGYILDHLANFKNYSIDFAKLMRGFLGDIMIDISNGELNYSYYTPCDNSPNNVINLILTNDIEYRDNNGVCVNINNITVNGAAYNSLYDWVFQMLFNIAQSVSNQTMLTIDQESFLNHIPMPIKKAIDNDIIIYGNSTDFTQIAATYSEIVGLGYAYALIKDFYSQVNETLMLVDTLTKNQQGGGDINTCKTELARIPHKTLKKMQKNLKKNIAIAQNDYANKLSNLIKHLNFSNQVASATKIVNDLLNTQINNSSLIKRISGN